MPVGMIAAAYRASMSAHAVVESGSTKGRGTAVFTLLLKSLACPRLRLPFFGALGILGLFLRGSSSSLVERLSYHLSGLSFEL
jgi:hypothetical protein